ncbi:unnamed protein product, partial [Mesorhabditis spiculigera]
MLDAGAISVKKVRVAVVGDKHVGKTSLIETFVTSVFPLNPAEQPEAHKMFYIGEQRYLFTLVEMREDWEKKRQYAHDIEAVLLCYDGEREQEARLSEKWTPRIAEWFPTAKVYLVRTKCDRLYDNYDDGHSPADVAKELNAVKAFECSAQDQTGIDKLFKELAEAHDVAHPEDKGRPQLGEGPLTEGSRSAPRGCAGIGSSIVSAVAASVPLVKQVGYNLKEITWNPDCFPAAKERINYYVPFLFRTRPSYDYKRIEEEHRLHEAYIDQQRKDKEAAVQAKAASSQSQSESIEGSSPPNDGKADGAARKP